MLHKYMGLGFIALGIAAFILTYGLSSQLLTSIDMGPGCSSAETCPHVTALNLSYIGYIFSIIMIVLGMYFILKHDMNPEVKEAPIKETVKEAAGQDKESKPEMPKNLDPDEMKVYGMLEKSEGMIFQSQLVEMTGFPKARVTRILDRMEGKGIVERRRRGMTNAVLLKRN